MEPPAPARPKVRALFEGDRDVRHVAKDRVLLLQLAPQSATKPAAHAIVHRDRRGAGHDDGGDGVGGVLNDFYAHQAALWVGDE